MRVMQYDLEKCSDKAGRVPWLVSYIDSESQHSQGAQIHVPPASQVLSLKEKGQTLTKEMTDSLPQGSRCHTAVGSFLATP